MAIAGTLEIQMLANMARLQSDMTQAKSMVGGAMKDIESAVASAKSALGALGIGLGVGYFVSLIKGSIDAADHLNDMTQSLGINIQALASYKLATSQSGSSLEGLAKGIKGLTNAFAEHGVELRTSGITAKDADGQIRQLADIFSKMPDGLEKTTLATKLFGKSGMELIPMLNMGAAGLDEAAQKSAKYAAVMTTLAPQADKFNDSMTELGMASKVASLSIINEIMPAMIGIAKAMALAAQESGGLTAAWVGLGGALSPIVVIFKGLNNSIDEVNIAMMKFFNTGVKDGSIAVLEAQIAARNKYILSLVPEEAKGADKKEFDVASWTAKYKQLSDALGLNKGDIAKAAAELKLYENALQSLEQQLGKLNHQTEYEKILYQELHGSLQKLTPAHKARLLEMAKQIDAQKFLTETTTAYWKVLDELDATEQKRIEYARQIIEGMRDSNEKIAFENSLIGMSADERERLNIEYERTIKLRGIDSQLQIDGINKQFDELAALVKTRQEMNQQVSTWTELSGEAGKFFGDLVVNGKSAFDNLKSYLKSFLQQLIALFAQKWILNVAAGALGSTALGSAAASAGTGTFAGSLLGSGAASGSLFSFMGGSQAASFGGVLDVGGMSLGSMGTSLMVAMPYVAAFVAAVLIIKKIMSNGGTPTSSLGDNTINFSAGGDIQSQASKYGGTNATTDNFVKGMQFAYASAARTLGIGAVASTFAYAANTGEDGKNPQFGLSGGAGGSSFTQGETSANEAAIQLAASRAVFAALQGSDLPGYLSKLFDGLTAGSMTLEQINNVEAFAAQLKSVRDALNETRTPLQVLQDQVKSGMELLGTSAKTFKDDFVAAIDAGLTPEKLAAWGKLGQTIDAVTESIKALNAMEAQVRAALKDISTQVMAFGQKVIDTAKGVKTAQDAISTAYWAAQDQVNTLLRQAADNLSRFATSIDDFLATIMPSQSIGALRGQLTSTAALAALGDADAQARLLNIARAVLKASEGSSATQQENARNVAFVRTTLEGVKQAIAPAQSAATTAAQDFATQLATAQRAVVDLGLIAEAAGAATERSATITLAGADLLEAYNAAVLESNTAQSDYTRAIALTTGITFIAADSMDSLVSSIATYATVRDAFVAAGGNMATILTGTGDAFQRFLDRVNTLIGTVPTKTVTADSLQDTWVNDKWRSPGGVILDRQSGTFSTANGASGTLSSLQAAFSDVQRAIMAGSISELQAGMNIIANVKAAGGDAKTLDAAMGWTPGTANAWAGAHSLPSFASGIDFVPHDMTARIHKGERVMTARDNQAANDDILSELRALRAEVVELKRPMDATATATERGTALTEQIAFGGFSLQTRAAGTPA